jgi:NAD(P)H dehydrogenase (quinone)
MTSVRERRTIAITGASGGVGSRVIRALTRIDPSRTVVALAREPSRVAESESGTVHAAYADYDDVDSLIAALDGSSSLIFISSDGDIEMMMRHHRNILSAVLVSEIEHVVYTSIIDIGARSPFYYTPVHRETEKLLRDTGISCCFARTSVFADFFFTTFLKTAIKTGAVELPLSKGSISLVTRDDVAEALAAASFREKIGELAFTGPAALDRQAIEEAMRSACVQSVSLSMIDEMSYRLQAEKFGISAWLIEAFSSLFHSIERGGFSEVSGDIEGLLGYPPATFSSFLRCARVRG